MFLRLRFRLQTPANCPRSWRDTIPKVDHLPKSRGTPAGVTSWPTSVEHSQHSRYRIPKRTLGICFCPNGAVVNNQGCVAFPLAIDNRPVGRKPNAEPS